MEKLSNLISELKGLRNNIPQLLYCDALEPRGWMSLRDEVVTFKRQNPDSKEIDVIINSPGGTPDDSYRIIRTLRENFETVNIVIPFWAKSGATLLSLGASTIIMDEAGEFGPIDIQIPKQKEDSPDFDLESALNDETSLKLIEDRAFNLFHKMFAMYHRSKDITINKINLSQQLMDFMCKFYEPLLKQINPYTLGEKKRKSDVSVSYAKRILIQYNKIDRVNRNELVDYLVTACPDHGYVIDYHVIKAYLSNVKLSKDIGVDYEMKLSEISRFFVENGDSLAYIGFIPEIQSQAEQETDNEVATVNSDAIIKSVKS